MENIQGFRKVSIASLLQDAVDLKIHVEKDFYALVKAGFDPDKLAQLIQRTQEVEQLNTRFNLDKQNYHLATRSLNQLKLESIKFRTTLREIINNVHICTDLKTKIPGMGQKRSFAEISQDLLDLAIHAEGMMEKAIWFSKEKDLVIKARQLSTELLQRASQHALLNPSASTLSSKRKGAINELKKCIQEIRCFARIVLQDNPTRVKVYRSY